MSVKTCKVVDISLIVRSSSFVVYIGQTCTRALVAEAGLTS